MQANQQQAQDIMVVSRRQVMAMVQYIQNTPGPSRQWSDPLMADFQRMLQANAPQAPVGDKGGDDKKAALKSVEKPAAKKVAKKG